MNILFYGFNKSLEKMNIKVLKKWLNFHSNKIKLALFLTNKKKAFDDFPDFCKYINNSVYTRSRNTSLNHLPSDKFLKKFSKFQPTFTILYTRLYYHSGPFFTDYQYTIKRLIEFFYNFLLENSINRLVFRNIPHQGYDYILYAVAQTLEIETKVFYQINFPDTCFVASSIESIFDAIHKEYKEDLKEKLPSKVSQEVYFSLLDDKPQFYMKNSKIAFREILKHFSKIFLFPIQPKKYSIYYFIPLFIHFKNLFEYFISYKKTFDSKKDYVYFALHFQPELTTSPLGENYGDQLLAIKTLSKGLSKGMQIIVKEHPKQFNQIKYSFVRTNSFYKELVTIPNVTLISQKHTTWELINGAKAVATITGTVGWESLVKGKPVLLFGNIFYKFFPKLVFNIKSVEDCQNAFNIIKKQKPLETKEIKKLFFNYLYAIEKAREHTTAYSFYNSISKLTEQENEKNYFEALEKIL